MEKKITNILTCYMNHIIVRYINETNKTMLLITDAALFFFKLVLLQTNLEIMGKELRASQKTPQVFSLMKIHVVHSEILV